MLKTLAAALIATSMIAGPVLAAQGTPGQAGETAPASKVHKGYHHVRHHGHHYVRHHVAKHKHYVAKHKHHLTTHKRHHGVIKAAKADR
jgi:hypothetical protein